MTIEAPKPDQLWIHKEDRIVYKILGSCPTGFIVAGALKHEFLKSPVSDRKTLMYHIANSTGFVFYTDGRNSYARTDVDFRQKFEQVSEL